MPPADVDLLPPAAPEGTIYVTPEALGGEEYRDGAPVELFATACQLLVDFVGTAGCLAFARDGLQVVLEAQLGRVTLAGYDMHGSPRAALLQFYALDFSGLLHQLSFASIIHARRFELIVPDGRRGPIIPMEAFYLPHGLEGAEPRGTWLGIFGEDAEGVVPTFLHTTFGVVRATGAMLLSRPGTAMQQSVGDVATVQIGDQLRPVTAQLVPMIWLRLSVLFDAVPCP